MALGTSARGEFSEPQPDCPIVASFRSCINGTSPGTEGSVVNSPRGRGDLAVGIACDPRYPRRRPGHRIGPVAPSRLVTPSTPSSAPANADDAVLTDPDLVRWDRDEIHTSPLDAPSMAASGRVSHGSNRHCDALRDSRIPDYRVTPAAELTLCLHDGKPIRPCRSARHALQLITSRRRPCSVPNALLLHSSFRPRSGSLALVVLADQRHPNRRRGTPRLPRAVHHLVQPPTEVDANGVIDVLRRPRPFALFRPGRGPHASGIRHLDLDTYAARRVPRRVVGNALK